MYGTLSINLMVQIKYFIFVTKQYRPGTIPLTYIWFRIKDLWFRSKNNMEPSNTRERQNELRFNDDQLSECELDFYDFSDETHVP
jgi:hypothetical protein